MPAPHYLTYPRRLHRALLHRGVFSPGRAAAPAGGAGGAQRRARRGGFRRGPRSGTIVLVGRQTDVG